MVTAFDCYLYLQQELSEMGVEESNLEARELTAFAVDLDARNTRNWKQIHVSEQQKQKVNEVLQRRKKDEPLAYILGEWDFYGNRFMVTPDVLIPRGDTEWLCDAAVQAAKNRKNPRILDLCSGSGCIGISIALGIPSASVTAVDYSQVALAVTKQNAELHQLTSLRFQAVHGNALEPNSIAGEFDLVVSNPPYITEQEMQELDHSVDAFEPHLALFGGEDGLDFYRAMAQNPAFHLQSGGEIFMECGWKQGEQVANLFREAGWKEVRLLRDLAGIERIVTAKK